LQHICKYICNKFLFIFKMNKKELYFKFINYLIETGYSEREISNKTGISTATINRAKNGITKLGTSNQKILDSSFPNELKEFKEKIGIEENPTPQDDIVTELRKRIKDLEDNKDMAAELIAMMKETLTEREKLIEELRKSKNQ
jgi:Trp operon repressor